MRNKLKIINDPIYGLITLSDEIIFDLIEHPYFQRLRRISQTALTSMVYPGAKHTRFQHAIGAMHLTKEAISVLRTKGHEISYDEEIATLIAILLHDIGHGPYSHALEHSIVPDLHHESISLLFMHKLNDEFGGRLTMAISIFKDNYEKTFLHQLVSSQLDMDRLDYINRDSFFCNIREASINSKRLITMLNVANGKLAIEDKGIYSVENFLMARRLMYWQVYLHKTVIVSENLLTLALKRARYVINSGMDLFASTAFKHFLKKDWEKESFGDDDLELYSRLDDYDVLGAIKEWTHCEDKILADLSNRIANRNLFKIKLGEEIIDKVSVESLKRKLSSKLNISIEDTDYYITSGKVENKAYIKGHENIYLLKKNGDVQDIAFSPDQQSISAISELMKKYYLIYPRELE